MNILASENMKCAYFQPKIGGLFKGLNSNVVYIKGITNGPLSLYFRARQGILICEKIVIFLVFGIIYIMEQEKSIEQL